MTNYLVASLGNPGAEYEGTRHNVGVSMLNSLATSLQIKTWKEEKKAKVAKGKLEKNNITLVIPQTFMNQSGLAIKSFFKVGVGSLKTERLILIHDDMDLALGKFKISFNRGSGGHRGVESVIQSVKSGEFIRIRVGVSPQSVKGLAKKPKGEEAVVKFILGKFKPAELDELKKVSEKVIESIKMIVLDAKLGREKAMGKFN